MRLGRQTQWSVRFSEPHMLVVALYVRDALGITESSGSDLPPLPPSSPPLPLPRRRTPASIEGSLTSRMNGLLGGWSLSGGQWITPLRSVAREILCLPFATEPN